MADPATSDMSVDDFNDLFSVYKEAPRGGADENGTQRNPIFEDLTELLAPWGERGEVFRTSENKKLKGKRLAPGSIENAALILRRTYSGREHQQNQVGDRLELHSQILRQYFQTFAEGITTISLRQDPIIIEEPYSELYYCRDQIREAIETTTDEEIKTELRLLQRFEQDYMAKGLEQIHSSVQEGMITFEGLWTLFKPGTLVILQNSKVRASPVDWCVNVKRFEIPNAPWKKKQRIQTVTDNSWILTVVSIEFDGSSFGPVEKVFKFPPFTGAREILSLPVAPLDLHPQKEDILKRLTRRGEIFQNICRESGDEKSRTGRGSLQNYDGPFWDMRLKKISRHSQKYKFPFRGVPEEPEFDFFESPSFQETGRVMVDPEGFFIEEFVYRPAFDTDTNGISKYNVSLWEPYPSQSMSNTIVESPQPIKLKTVPKYCSLDTRALEPNELIRTPPMIFCYSFSSKTWGAALVDGFEVIKWQEEAYDRLQMDPVQKEIVRGLIDTHTASRSTFDDFIPGKGRGLVFLLHGPPGCGKTMTAECIAETLHRPLCCISVSEISDSDSDQFDKVEGNLVAIFRRAARWEAILLFDEADVFLKSRKDSKDDNSLSLTSIFLRLLEYQPTIIFLTTNRVADFDAAFYSRIHITIRYNQLGPEQRRFVWENLSTQTENDFVTGDFERLSHIPLDGRSIKNIIRVASLHLQIRGRKAGDQSVRLGIQDIQAVLRYSVGDPDNKEVAEKVQLFYDECA